MEPARAVGGDLFDFIDLGGDRLGLAVGDVSDKGVPAAIFMAMTRSLLRACAGKVGSPREVLEEVNRQMLEMNDAGMFVTAIYGILEGKTGVFRYARAGHELPMLCAGDGALIKAPMGTGQALGIFEDPVFDEQTLELPRGASLLIYTDGITDAVNPAEEMFGIGRLEQVMRSCCSRSAKTLCEELLGAVYAFQGGAPQHDDLTVVAVRSLDG
jgi:sigma-B regulation protein RsbU (phosphoserine phosphatase)